MSFMKKHFKLLGVASSCAVIGAAASAIASAGAAAPSTSSPAHAAALKRAAVRRALRGAVHGDLVVASGNGAFVTVTFDRGFVQSVSGRQLAIKEGTKSATYRTITLTIPGDAVVRDNRQSATLGDLKAGQHVLVLQGPKRTLVVARDVK